MSHTVLVEFNCKPGMGPEVLVLAQFMEVLAEEPRFVHLGQQAT